MVQRLHAQPRQTVAAIATVLTLAGTLFLGARQLDTTPPPREQWLKLVFGKDGETADWDGKLSVEHGQLLTMSQWGLESVDQLQSESFSWRIKTGRVGPESGDNWRRSFPEAARGFLVKVQCEPTSRLRVTTQQGNFSVTMHELRPGRPTSVLAGRATVEVLGAENLVAETRTNDDFPAIALGPNGHRYVAWIAHHDGSRASRLLVRDMDEPGSAPGSISGAGEFSTLSLLGTPHGLRAVWCSPGSYRDWDIYTATQDGATWTPPERLTDATGSDFHLAVAQGPTTTWIAWQSFRSGNGDIYAKCFRDGGWSRDIRVTEGPANEWEPAIDVDSTDRAWIAYDTYEHGNYDVYLQSVSPHQGELAVSPRVAIARSPRFEAHASVLADRMGRVWVAFDRGGSGWGKDTGNLSGGEPAGGSGEPLHRSRQLVVRCVVDGNLHEPSAPLPQVSLLPQGTRFYEYPQLVDDGKGRLWLLFRMCRQGSLKVADKGNCWDIFATTFTQDGWLQPIQFPRSEGRQNQRVSVVADGNGQLHAAWSEGNHFVVSPDRKYSVHFGTLPAVAEKASSMPTQPISVEPPGKPESVPSAPWTMRRGGDEYRLFFGDLHRHTNISICLPRDDGCQTDAHRYALDAATLDFLAITDHTHDLNPYAWWRIQSEADRFHIPGRYVPIYAYERSNFTEGGGHRNVYFLDRGWDINGSDYYYRYQSHTGQQMPNTDPDKSLYPWLKERGAAFTIAHTPAYAASRKRGTWDFHDSEVEPVAEIFQGYRQSYERPGRSVPEEASLWHALAKGYRLGFVASSDHRSTHLSYACVWATEKSRAALFEAILARRTYAATDRIALDFRVDNTLMGGQTSHHADNLALQIRALGTDTIDEIQVIRSGQVLDTLRPRSRRVDVQYTDPSPLPGRSYYYVRLQQADGNLAWASPIWVSR